MPGRLKRVVFLFLFACLLPVSCDSENANPGALPDVSELAHPLASHLKDTYTDDLPGIRKRKYIRVLTTFNRTNFFLSGSRPYGFEYSLLKDYEKFLNRNLRRNELRVVMEFIPVSREQLVPALIEGRGDIVAAGLTITPERQKRIDFTIPYLSGIDEVVVSHVDVKGLGSAADLSGRTVYVRRSSSYYESLLALNRELKNKGLKPVNILEADETLETEDILEMVNTGAIEITVADSHLAKLWSKVLTGIRVYEGIRLREGGDIAWGVRQGNPELKASVDAFLRKRRQGTLLGNIYFNRYFKSTQWIKNPLARPRSGEEERKIELFRKYADRYGFDWTLIMALAFQESGLDNARRSRAGAVGVMQIRPSTAKDKSIGIDDVRPLENNIHAGVKYLAHLRDQYFADPALRERDRVRLTLAAYNAGPTKIRQARRLASETGLDPDRWFRNVEMAALRIVGQETVRYVSNINKYYVLLSMAYETDKVRERKKEEMD